MRVVSSVLEFKETLRSCSKSGNILIVDFYADWCGPCRFIAPHFEALSAEYQPKNFVFLKVNTEHCRELSRQEGISALPTFKLYQDERCVRTIVGSNLSKLRAVLDEFSLDYSLIQLKLHENDEEKIRAFKCLHNIMDKILTNPQDETCRRITLTSTDFTETLLVIPGCMDFLFSAGFQPTTSAAKSQHETMELTNSELNFMDKMLTYRSFVLNYMDPQLQKQARELIPSEQLLLSACQNNGCSEDEVKPEDFLRELMSWFKSEFFKWADNFECQTCGSKMASHSVDQPRRDNNEMDGDANVVEVYVCKTNRQHPTYRFPRYNNPKKLLETRLGRCGEWANCFALFLVSAGRSSSNQPWFDACRFIMDWTDHVWCEVWLEDKHTKRKRWMHCDPCEGQLDKPLLYESGWNKKVNYILAYTVPPRQISSNQLTSIDIQDVTWRYTQNFSEVRSRRNLIRESVLAAKLANIHKDAVQSWSSFLKETTHSDENPFSWKSILNELISFLHPPKSTGQLPGRQTGSLEWRAARGELGQQASSGSLESPTKGSKYIIRPSDVELESGVFHLRYNSALNIYERPSYNKTNTTNESSNSSSGNCSTRVKQQPSSSSSKLIENARKTGLYGWQSLAYEWKNIFRKVELDWHMVYLAREEDCNPTDEGIITWMLDLRDTDYVVDKISLFTNMVCHSSDSHAHFVLCSGEYPSDGQVDKKCETTESVPKSCICLQPGSASLFNSDAMNGSDFLCLKARLWSDDNSAKLSSLAWQQAQLFRQKDNDFDTWSLEWKVELIKKKSKKEE
ncbi:unnamed protein product [Trichobilharzia szidati]|nr:unnamed protein product [Trichobilharzia szidati]